MLNPMVRGGGRGLQVRPAASAVTCGDRPRKAELGAGKRYSKDELENALHQVTFMLGPDVL